MRARWIKSDLVGEFDASSKLNAGWEFVSPPRAEGRRSASEFLDAHSEDLGNRSAANTDLLFADA